MNRPTTGRRSRQILLATILFLAAPIFCDLAVFRTEALFRYFSSDAFYYLTIGRNFATYGFPTFDQCHPTNGFHPLWQAAVALLFRTCMTVGLGEVALLFGVVLLGVVAVCLSVFFVAKALDASGRPLTIVRRCPPRLSMARPAAQSPSASRTRSMSRHTSPTSCWV